MASPLKRLVIVAETSLTVEALWHSLGRSGEFRVVGYANTTTASATLIVAARPDAVLITDVHRSERAVELIRELQTDGGLSVIALTREISPELLDRVFDAGATGVISNATNPAAFVTLLRETLSGHVFHNIATARSRNGAGAVRDGPAVPLTSREVEILGLVAAGLTNSEVARALWVTEQTVKFHLRNIYRKLGVANRTEASHFAHVNGLVSNRPEMAVAS
jgi:DNA-binding NarL/FixJ family response regulator